MRSDIEAAGGRLAAISVDPRDESTKLAAKLGLHYPLLSDPDLHTASAYGVAMAGQDIAVPSVFVVRQGGTIAWKKVGEAMDDRPTAAEVVAQLRAAAEAGGAR